MSGQTKSQRNGRSNERLVLKTTFPSPGRISPSQKPKIQGVALRSRSQVILQCRLLLVLAPFLPRVPHRHPPLPQHALQSQVNSATRPRCRCQCRPTCPSHLVRALVLPVARGPREEAYPRSHYDPRRWVRSSGNACSTRESQRPRNATPPTFSSHSQPGSHPTGFPGPPAAGRPHLSLRHGPLQKRRGRARQ